jgi:hypothetical protein
VIIPDVPIKLASRPEVTRLREIARAGLLTLTTTAVDRGEIGAGLRSVASAPTYTYSMEEIDPGRLLVRTLGARPDEIWLVRPDAHVAAILPSGASGMLIPAAQRMLGHPAAR